MTRFENIVVYLLERLVADAEKKPFQTIYEQVETVYPTTQRKFVEIDQNSIEDDVEEIYRAYPTKDVGNGGRCLGKGERCKEKIRRLLGTKTKDEILESINFYIGDCAKTGTFLKDFLTFLNNMPEVEPILPETKPSKYR